jgi:phosphonate transport system substrate-binding protein
MKVSRRMSGSLRARTFLAPKLFPLYDFVIQSLADRLRHSIDLHVAESYDDLADADLAFLCSLPYVIHRERFQLEPLAAPVLTGARYGGQAIYFSDVIVNAKSRFQNFGDLRGQTWSFNEPLSQSGYGHPRDHLIGRDETNGFFSRVVASGWHERSIEWVAAEKVAASAIDSHLLEVVLHDEPDLARSIRIIDTIGPSPVQPLVASRRLPADLRAAIREVVVRMHEEADPRDKLQAARVARWIEVTDATYDPVRRMHERAIAVDFLTLR